MKSFATLAALTVFCVVLLTLTPGGDAQGQVSKVDVSDLNDNKFSVFLSDLGIVSFDGTVKGSTVYVGGPIKNLGKITYKGDRTVKLYHVPSVSFGRYKLLRTQTIPKLEVNQTWQASFTLTTQEAPVGSKLLLYISGKDADSQNDTKTMLVRLVY